MRSFKSLKKTATGILLMTTVMSQLAGCGTNTINITAGDPVVSENVTSSVNGLEIIPGMTSLKNVAVSEDFSYINDATSPSVRYFLDKTAPVVSLNDIYLSMGDTCTLDDFINTITDVTPVSADFVAEPDFTLYGRQDVSVIVTDSNYNQTVSSATLTILPVKSEYVMELTVSHNTPEPEEFLMEPGYDVYFTEDLPAPEDLTIGSYDVYLNVDGYDTTSVLTYIDTESPSGNAISVKARYGATYTADQLVKDIVDATDVTCTFADDPDWALEGTQTLDVVLTDEGGNTTHVYPVVELIIDTAPPVIQAASTTVYIGNSLSYTSCITVTDNLDVRGDIALTVDASGVDLNTAGTYEAYITATDKSGNTSTATLTINVTEKPAVVQPNYQDAANTLALQIMSQIITDGMTTEQKVYAIWHWAKYNISYTHDFAIDNFASGAYRAMTNRRSNCFGYASVIKTMCDLLGVPNFVICDTQRPHYWNAIDCGDGYYHWDATPRLDGTIIWKWTDAQLLQYSNTHGGTHKFDRAQYPAIN